MQVGFKECARRVLGDLKEGAWCFQVGFKEQGSRRVLGGCKLGSRRVLGELKLDIRNVQGGC